MREIYHWVEWFGELSSKIANHEPSWLAERAHRIPWKEDNEDAPLLRHGDENIDPFSFIYSLAAHHHARRRVYRSVSETFGLSSKLPLDLDEAFIFPTPPLVTALFHNKGVGNPSSLWRLFRSAVKGIGAVSDEDFMLAQRDQRSGHQEAHSSLVSHQRPRVPAVRRLDTVPRRSRRRTNESRSVNRLQERCGGASRGVSGMHAV